MLTSAVAVVIFRGELALLLGTAAAADLLVGRKIRQVMEAQVLIRVGNDHRLNRITDFTILTEFKNQNPCRAVWNWLHMT